MTVFDGMTGIMENAFINVKGVRHSITAEVVVPDARTDGVIIAQAGYFGGWALYMKGGRVVHDYNFFGLSHTKVSSKAPLAPGAHTIVYEFVPDEAKPGTGGKSTISVDGQVVAEGHISRRRSRSCSRPTKAWTSAWTTRRWCRTTTSSGPPTSRARSSR